MSEQPDKESKTEQATEKKKRDSIEKGNTPQSRELSNLSTLVVATLVLAFSISATITGILVPLKFSFFHAADVQMNNGADFWKLYNLFVEPAAWEMVKIFAALGVAGVVVSFLQNPPSLVWNRLQPQLSRISIKSGWQRIFGKQVLVELVKTLSKIGVMLLVAMLILKSNIGVVANSMLVPLTATPSMLQSLSLQLFSGMTLGAVFIAVFDLIWTRHKWAADLMMTKQEVKDELKQSEGDPLVKARMKSLARDRSRRQMILAVPEATVILANPTHYSVALSYIPGIHDAPSVVAKGQDLLALRIREVATEHSIPIVENKPLARAMYDFVEVGQAIPPEFYEAVAEVIQYVYGLERQQ